MKIINPSATIIEKELAGLSVCQRIDRCASVCYQRPPKPTEEDAEAFCLHLIEQGHLPALEFAVVHLVIPSWCIPVSKYIHVSQRYGDEFIAIGGSIRAMKEAYNPFDVQAFLAGELPMFFGIPSGTTHDFDSMEGVRFATPEEIPWQHRHVAVRVICSRAISHQLVRHRPCSVLQESQRYCRYDDDVVFIRPEWASDDHFGKRRLWERAMENSEFRYQQLLKNDMLPQQARGVLPNDTKTELVMYASLPEWRHIFAMRCAKAADPEARRVMLPLREQFRAEYPEMWEEN